jgi:hypothetical protein
MIGEAEAFPSSVILEMARVNTRGFPFRNSLDNFDRRKTTVGIDAVVYGESDCWEAPDLSSMTSVGTVVAAPTGGNRSSADDNSWER